MRFAEEDAKMKTPSTRKAAFDVVRAELISMVPLAFRSMAKPYITDEHVARILDAALDALQRCDRCSQIGVS
jgi:hypothetical protein